LKNQGNLSNLYLTWGDFSYKKVMKKENWLKTAGKTQRFKWETNA
jgi:hypothetical protein